jgi:hypothetical protein
MWHGGPSKQCLWLGTGQYRDGCWNTATNSGSDSYAANNSYSMRAHNTDADTKRASSVNADTNSYGASFAVTYTDTDTYRNRNATTNSDANTYGEFTAADAHANTQGAPKAAADSASSAVREAVIREK